jgi:hypothetical protein
MPTFIPGAPLCEMNIFLNGVICLPDIGAYDHLILAAVSRNPENAGYFFDGCIVRHAVILQCEPKSCGAVRETGDVLFSADGGDQFCRQSVKIHYPIPPKLCAGSCYSMDYKKGDFPLLPIWTRLVPCRVFSRKKPKKMTRLFQKHVTFLYRP